METQRRLCGREPLLPLALSPLFYLFWHLETSMSKKWDLLPNSLIAKLQALGGT